MRACNFGAFYLICERRQKAMDRNLLAHQRKAFLDTIDKLRSDHEKQTGCQCFSETYKNMGEAELASIAEVDV